MSLQMFPIIKALLNPPPHQKKKKDLCLHFFSLRENVDFQVLFALTLSLPLLRGEVAARLRVQETSLSTVFHDTRAPEKSPY